MKEEGDSGEKNTWDTQFFTLPHIVFLPPFIVLYSFMHFRYETGSTLYSKTLQGGCKKYTWGKR